MTTVDSLSRSCFRSSAPRVTKDGPPKGAQYKLPKGAKHVTFHHEFATPGEGIADAGVTHIQVHPACDYTFQIRRIISERELGDWGASVLLIDNLLTRHRADFAQGARVLELGCGLGLPGLVCASVGADVVLTDKRDKDDKHHDALALLEENIKFNFMGPARRPPGVGTGRAGMLEFEWDADGAREIVETYGYFDFVICADCVFQPMFGKSWNELAACFDVFCGPSTECVISLQRRNQDNVESFLDLLFNKYKFLTAKQTAQYSVPAGSATIEIYTLRRIKDTEQFHIDLQTASAEGTIAQIKEAKGDLKKELKAAVPKKLPVAEDDIVQAWRGPIPTKRYK